MHIEFLVEDQSGERMLNRLLPKLLGDPHTFAIRSYKGVGRIPRNMKDPGQATNRILLENLPKLLKGYGKTFRGYGPQYPAAVVLLCDLDDKCQRDFKSQLKEVLARCDPQPEARFCFAIEEGEAWLLGDFKAVRAAYPKAKEAVLNAYVQDSICGTWELLADAVYPGGHLALSSKGWRAVGLEKSAWADAITPKLDLDNNQSPSFAHFLQKVKLLLDHE